MEDYKYFLTLIGFSLLLGLVAGTNTLLGKLATFAFNLGVLIFAGTAIWALISGDTTKAMQFGLSALSVLFGAGIGFFLVKKFKE
jgi:flagellar motor component MotA